MKRSRLFTKLLLLH